MDILKWATQIEGDVIAWRRKIYEHPELSDCEFETLALIRQVLTESGVNFVGRPQRRHHGLYRRSCTRQDRISAGGYRCAAHRRRHLQQQAAKGLLEQDPRRGASVRT